MTEENLRKVAVNTEQIGVLPKKWIKDDDDDDDDDDENEVYKGSVFTFKRRHFAWMRSPGIRDRSVIICALRED